jgi:hypothetical protein
VVEQVEPIAQGLLLRPGRLEFDVEQQLGVVAREHAAGPRQAQEGLRQDGDPHPARPLDLRDRTGWEIERIQGAEADGFGPEWAIVAHRDSVHSQPL